GSLSALTSQQADLMASEIIEYAHILSNAASQIRLRDYQDTQISLENNNESGYTNAACTESECKIFDIDGGGVSWQTISEQSAASASSKWQITGEMAVQDIGTTCATDSCTELLALALDIDSGVCEKINENLGIVTPTVIPDNPDAAYAKFTGTYAYADTIGDVAGSSKLAAHNAGCFYSTADSIYIFYRVLIVR
ncbi:MAG: hypothetical protein OEY94_09085, partial [Alphaproteobacteria bacterium]|nr:hypothetical protein [Alphaproteobacteria bacterium]